MSATRHRFHNMCFEAAVISHIVALTLTVMFSERTDEDRAMWLTTVVMSAVGSFLLIVGFVMHAVKKFRLSIPPLVYMLVVGVSAIFGVVEAVLCALMAKFGKAAKSDIMVAAMVYAITSVVLVAILIGILIAWPPISETAADVERSVQRVTTSKKTQDSLRKPPSQRSQKSSKKQVQLVKSERSRRL